MMLQLTITNIIKEACQRGEQIVLKLSYVKVVTWLQQPFYVIVNLKMPKRFLKFCFKSKLPTIYEEILPINQADLPDTPPELPPPRLPPRRIHTRGSTCHTLKLLKKPAYLNLNQVYDNIPANRELYINICPLHPDQLSCPYCVICNN